MQAKRNPIRIGEIFGKLTVLEKSGKNKWRANKYLCSCSCKQQLCIVLGSSLRRGLTKSCGCSHYNPRTEIGQSSWNTRISQYKYGAQKRDIIYNLLREDFINISSQQCYWCGTPPISYNAYSFSKRTRPSCVIENALIKCNGIDRLDNKIGYESSNCVACCKLCNYMKSDYSEQEFLSHVEKIYNHQQQTRKKAIA